jgi:ribosome-binding factor A
MKKDGGRAARLEGAILGEVTDVIHRGLKDPRVHGAGLLTVTRVMLNEDLRVARVFVSFAGDLAAQGAADKARLAVAAALKGLAAAAGFVRGEIGRRLGLKFTPELRFVEDTTADHVAKIERLLRGDPE